MALHCGKSLLALVCGHSILPSDEVVGEELQDALKHIKDGLSVYVPFTEEAHEKWAESSRAKKEKKDFIAKLGKLLNISSEQAWQIFQLFLQHEYRGSAAQLSAAAITERDESNLLHQLFMFHLSDPLHLLSCRRYILASDPSHPHHSLLKEFVSKMLDPEKKYGEELVSQLCKIAEGKAEGISTFHAALYLPHNALHLWVSHRLMALKQQLVTLVVYYGTPGHVCQPETVITLLQLAQYGGIGREMIEKSGVDTGSYSSILEAVDGLHAVLLMLVISADADPETYPLCQPESSQKINSIMQSLGSRMCHSPVLFAWALLQSRVRTEETASGQGNQGKDRPPQGSIVTCSRLISRAAKMNIFKYLQSILDMPAVRSDKLLEDIAASVIYAMLCVAGSLFDLEKIGERKDILGLAQVCLSHGPPSEIFWAEEVGGGADLFLPHLLERFPFDSYGLLQLASSLASASKESGCKVTELISGLVNFTWPLVDVNDMSILHSHAIARRTFSPIPHVSVPVGCTGAVLNLEGLDDQLMVSWNLPTNGWQVILGAVHALKQQIEAGNLPEGWPFATTVSGLHLVSAVLDSAPTEFSLFLPLTHQAFGLLQIVSKVLKPSYELVVALLTCLASVAKIEPSVVMDNVSDLQLLPTLPVCGKEVKVKDMLMSYKVGQLRSFICAVEVSKAQFPVLKHYATILDCAVKEQIDNETVRGGMVFMMQEVVPHIFQWKYTNFCEKMSVMEKILSLIHHVLEDGACDKIIQDMIVWELVSPTCGSGDVLRTILETGCLMENTMDQQPPFSRSPYVSKLSYATQLALSVIHRTVGQYLVKDREKYPSTVSELFLGGAVSARKQSSSLALPFGKQQAQSPHLALTVARFIFHRLNPRLPYLALRILTHIAKELPIPLVACFGLESEGIRDSLLSRLEMQSEDIRIKVALIQLLSASAVHQPGLIRLFLTPVEPLLDSILQLLSSYKETTIVPGLELFSSLVEFISTLWQGSSSTAVLYLREQKGFWNALLYPLVNTQPSDLKHVDSAEFILNILSLEYFSAVSLVSEDAEKEVKIFLDSTRQTFKQWSEFIVHLDETSNRINEDKMLKLLTAWSNFLIIIISRSQKLLTDEQKADLAHLSLDGIVNCLKEENGLHVQRVAILSELFLILMKQFHSLIRSSPSFWRKIGLLLMSLHQSVVQLPFKMQSVLLSGCLASVLDNSTASTPDELRDSVPAFVETMLAIVETHSTLLGGTMAVHSSAVLTIACSFLQRLMSLLIPSSIDALLSDSNLIAVLLHSADMAIKTGNSGLVQEILLLLSSLTRHCGDSREITTGSLISSVSLSVSSQPEPSILSEYLWSVYWAFQSQGPPGIEGAISALAVHAHYLVDAFLNPHLHPQLALAGVSLVLLLIPHHPLWRVLHNQSFKDLVEGVSLCLHRTTRLLQMKGTLDPRGDLKKQPESGSTSSSDKSASENNAVNLINQLIEIMFVCLRVLQLLSPDITEVISCPVADLEAWRQAPIQPSTRRQGDLPSASSNLATLADVMDLYQSSIPKEHRTLSPTRASSSMQLSGIHLDRLHHCAEISLYLLVVYSALFLRSPNIPHREAREIRTFLSDETELFIKPWVGARLPPCPVAVSAGQSLFTRPDGDFLKLCAHIVTSLCRIRR